MSEIQAQLSRRAFIGGQWRNPGDVVDLTGYRQGAVEKMLDDGLLFFSAATAPVSSEPSADLMNSFAEMNLRLWQLESDVIAETEGFTGWTGEAFLTNQNNVASVVGDVSVARAARLGGGGLSIAAANPIEGLAPGDPFMGGYFVGVIDPSQVPYDSGEVYADASPPRYALIVGPASLEPAAMQTWSSSLTTVAGARTWWDGLRASQALIDGGHSIGTWLANLRTSDPVPADGGSDWYIPSLGELSLIYQNLKPDTAANSTDALLVQDFPAQQSNANQGDSWGPYGGSSYYNPVSEPPYQGYNSASPAQTSAAAFQLGGTQALDYSASSYYWSSTESADARARLMLFRGSVAGSQNLTTKSNATGRARPVRRLEL